jgi:hypothetical protein
VRVSIKRTARIGVLGVVTRAAMVQLNIPGMLSRPTGTADAREATPGMLGGGRQLRVAEAELIVTDGTGSRSARLTAVGAAAQFAGGHTGDAGAGLPSGDAVGPR